MGSEMCIRDSYNIGLLGKLRINQATGKFVQYFKSPSEFDWKQKDLIDKDEIYFLHPGLHSKVADSNPGYYLNPNCLIGNGYVWQLHGRMDALPQIFMSHCSTDKPVVEYIFQGMSEKLSAKLPHRVWYDSWNLHLGQNIHQEIERGVAGSKLVLLFLSKESLKSQWVDKEWRQKHSQEITDNRIRVVVVRLQEVTSQDVPGFLRDKKFMSINCDKEDFGCLDEISRLADELNWILRRDE